MSESLMSKALFHAALAAVMVVCLVGTSEATGVVENRSVDVSLAAVRLAERETCVLERGFSDAVPWKAPKHGGYLTVRRDGAANTLTLTAAPAVKPKDWWDTYWCIQTERMEWTGKTRKFVLSFLLSTDYAPALSAGDTEEPPYRNEITWYDASGAKLALSPLVYSVLGDGEAEIRIAGTVPEGARKWSISLGFDRRDLPKGKHVVYRNLRMGTLSENPAYAKCGSFESEVMTSGAVAWKAQVPAGTTLGFQIAAGDTAEAAMAARFFGPDGTDKTFYGEPFAVRQPFCRYRAVMTSDGTATPSLESVTVGSATHCDWSLLRSAYAPFVRLASASPFADAQSELRLGFDAGVPVDWKTLKVIVDGADRTAEVRRDGDFACVSAPVGGWTNGLHEAKVTVGDAKGRSNVSRKFFYRGETPKTPQVKIRRDGAVVIDGKPTFIVGAFGVKKGNFNAFSLDRAIGDLKAAGFNLVHTYWHSWQPEFQKALRKHDMKTLFWSTLPNSGVVAKMREDPTILAWYVADDTVYNTSPAQLLDLSDGIKAVDPTRLVVHASGMWGAAEVSNYRDYADKADVFIAEQYPIRGLTDRETSNCVAYVVSDMLRHREETRLNGGRRPRAIWPLLQYFEGYNNWKRMPTPAEARAMVYAAIVNGAKAILWYTYEDKVTKEGLWNRGFTATEESWNTVRGLVGEIRRLEPVLLDESPDLGAKLLVTAGPALDGLRNPSVTCMAKRCGGKTHFLAVNATRCEVAARVEVPGIEAFDFKLPPLGVAVMEK